VRQTKGLARGGVNAKKKGQSDLPDKERAGERHSNLGGGVGKTKNGGHESVRKNKAA